MKLNSIVTKILIQNTIKNFKYWTFRILDGEPASDGSPFGQLSNGIDTWTWKIGFDYSLPQEMAKLVRSIIKDRGSIRK